MLNRVIEIGRITKDPVLRKTPNGTSVVSFTLAVNRNIKKEGQPEADFINCVAWNKTADFMAQYVKKVRCLDLRDAFKRATTMTKTESVCISPK